MNKKIKKNDEKNKINIQKQKEKLASQAWKVIGLCLDAMENRLLSMSEDASSADLSKLNQMFGTVFDRLIELAGSFCDEKIIKKIEDFD